MRTTIELWRISLLGVVLVLIADAQIRSAPFDEIVEPAAKIGEAAIPTVPSIDVPAVEVPHLPPTAKLAPVAEAIRRFQQGDIDGCLAQLRAAVAKHPALPTPKLMLADFYLHAERFAPAKRLLEEVGSSGTQHPQLFLSLANLALAEGRLSDAWSHLHAMEVIGTPDNWAADEKQWFKRELVQGQVTVAERRANWQQAQVLLAAWVTEQPESPEVRARWARSLFFTERFDDAFTQFDIAFQQNNQFEPPQMAMAMLHLRRGEFEHANKWYEQAVAAHEKNPMVRAGWATALLMQDRAAEAAEQAEAARRLGLATPQLDLLQGMIARQAEKYREAEQHLLNALSQSPQNADAQYHLIVSLASQPEDTKRAKAVNLARVFAEQSRQSPPAVTALAWALHISGETAEASKLLTPVATRTGAAGESIYLLGLLMESQGKDANAADVARHLEPVIRRPEIFITRPQAEVWLQKIKANRTLAP